MIIIGDHIVCVENIIFWRGTNALDSPPPKKQSRRTVYLLAQGAGIIPYAEPLFNTKLSKEQLYINLIPYLQIYHYYFIYKWSFYF